VLEGLPSSRTIGMCRFSWRCRWAKLVCRRAGTPARRVAPWLWPTSTLLMSLR
jgi:hypothetical protein